MTAKGKRLRLWHLVACAVAGLVVLPVAIEVAYFAWRMHDRTVKRYVEWKPGAFQELRTAGEIAYDQEIMRQRVVVTVDDGLVDVEILDGEQLVWRSDRRFSDYHRWVVARDTDGSVWLCSSDIGIRRVERIDGEWTSEDVAAPAWFKKQRP
ncbi:MAG TPA: hypothetical protein VK157_16585 [Phycisphaerales bacterium]|nr:hypothetical protein [Phycisphaerales bacterium]